MLPQLQENLPVHISDAICYTTSVVIVSVILVSISESYMGPNLDNIPTVGSRTWLGSWWTGIKFLINATDLIQEGYKKHKGTPFKVSMFYRWMVIVSGRHHVEEFRMSRDDELSFLEAASDTLKAEHTLGRDTHYDPYHITILRSRLNRNLTAMYADIKDEIVTSIDEILDLNGHEWKSLPALNIVQQIVSRTSNRAFVGLPLCRNPDWVNLNIQFTLDVIKGAAIITLFPKFMAPVVARFMTNVPGSIKRGVKHLSPIIETRRRNLDEYGRPQADHSNDLLSWLIEGAEGSRRNAHTIASRILAVNFAAIHTSSNSFTQALYNLAANPQYIQILRDEVESITKEEGWSKASVAKMYKVDSFMKESQRMNGIGIVNMVRKSMKDVTFSDGTVIPKGAYVVMAIQSMHSDNEYYENAEIFDPWRFANMRADADANASNATKHMFATTSPEYLVFGHGRHACPGRFFAASTLNTMLAHLVISYDIKLAENNMTRPRNLVIGTSVAANPTARVMFRKRIF